MRGLLGSVMAASVALTVFAATPASALPSLAPAASSQSDTGTVQDVRYRPWWGKRYGWNNRYRGYGYRPYAYRPYYRPYAYNYRPYAYNYYRPYPYYGNYGWRRPGVSFWFGF
jgi:hypothetical protein